MRNLDRDLPGVPSLGGAIRLAGQDFYYHSWRLLPANVAWSVVALTVLALVLVSPAAIALAPILAIPTAGIFRLTTRIVRGESVSFYDALDAWREDLRPTLLLGAGLAATSIVLGSNVIAGLTAGSPLGWALATLAGWGLVAGWLYAWTAWPILVDPARVGRPSTERAKLAALVVLARPASIGAFGIVLAVLLVVSAAAVVAVATVSVAFAALVSSRFVLPAADRLEIVLARAVLADPATGSTADPDRPEASARS